MKINFPIKSVLTTIILFGILAGAVLFSGCDTPTTGPLSNQPTAFDRTLYDITTNVVQATNFVNQTNYFTVTTTNSAGTVQVVTNPIPLTVPIILSVTNFGYTPKAQTSATVGVVGDLASATGIPYAGLITTALTGLIGLWGYFKTNQGRTAATAQASQANAIAGNTAQILQVARNVIAQSPNGATLTTQLNAYMMQHQQDAMLANEVAGLVDKWVDPNDNALSGIASTIIAAATTPPPAKAS